MGGGGESGVFWIPVRSVYGPLADGSSDGSKRRLYDGARTAREYFNCIRLRASGFEAGMGAELPDF